jgi:hypothetical protein
VKQWKNTLLALASIAMTASAQSTPASTQTYVGTWYEMVFGEQTIDLRADHRCRFVRGATELFGYDACTWADKDSHGELTFTYSKGKGTVYMKRSDELLLMSYYPHRLIKIAADTFLERPKDLTAYTAKWRKGYLGKWESKDHTSTIVLRDDHTCSYSAHEETVFGGSDCSWDAGNDGATMVFTNPKKPDHNVALFLRVMDGELLGARDKSQTLPRRAEVTMTRVKE